MAKTLTEVPSIKVLAQNETGLVTFGYTDGLLPTTAGVFAPGCVIIDTGGKKLYYNSGTTASPTWNSITEIDSAEIAAGAVTLAKLASGVTPSHVVKYGGKTTWAGGGDTHAVTVTGAVAGDLVIATIQTKPTEAAYLVGAVPTTDTVTFELSAANTSNDAVIAYTVLRAAA